MEEKVTLSVKTVYFGHKEPCAYRLYEVFFRKKRLLGVRNDRLLNRPAGRTVFIGRYAVGKPGKENAG